MSTLQKRYQVFLSSTYEDLIDHRKAVIQALLELDCIPSGMELFSAADDDQWTLIKSVIDDCDYYVVIIAGRYGSIGPAGISYTQMEYEYAVSKNKPILAFLHKNISELAAKYVESGEPQKGKLEAFRQLAQRKHCKFWMTSDELGSVVSRSLINAIKTKPAIGWVRGNLVADESAAQEILKLRRQVAKLEDLVPKGNLTRPETRSMDYFQKIAERYPRNAIQEAWTYMERAVNYALITHDLEFDPTSNLNARIMQLVRHGDLKRQDADRVLGDFYQRWAAATNDPAFNLSPGGVLDTVRELLTFASVLVDKCDGLLAIRNDTVRMEKAELPELGEL